MIPFTFPSTNDTNPGNFSALCTLVGTINEDNCASIISLISAAGTIISVVLNVRLGYLMDIYGIDINIYISLIIGLICILFLTVFKFKESKESEN